jgi:hypothetical protein
MSVSPAQGYGRANGLALPQARWPGLKNSRKRAGISYLPPSVLGTTMSPSPKTEIHSASTERLTSDSLEQLQRLLTDAYNERNDLSWEASRAGAESNDAARR